MTITNAAAASVTLTPPFVITGSNAGEFSVGAPSATVLAPQDSATVLVSVFPATIGAKSASLQVTSADGGSPSVALLASTCPVISVAPASLPGGFVGIPYSQTATASGGTGPYSFAIALGAPPTGLALASSGVLSGSPVTAGSFSFSIKATDATGCSGTAPYSVTIATATLEATPGSVSFGSVHVGATATAPVTIKNTSGFTVTLTPPFTITGADASQFSIGSPGTTTLAANASTNATATFAPNTGGLKNATLNITSSNGGTTTAALSGSGDTASAGNGIVIGELRFRGPNGGNDELVELYNSTDLPIDISGYILKGSSSAAAITNRATIVAGAVVPAHGHYLLVNAGAGAPLIGLADQTYGTGIGDDGGVAITLSNGTILDQVGLSAGSAFKEGTPLVSLGSTNLDHSYERKPGGANGNGADTNDNGADFGLVAPSSPQNLASPIVPPLITASSPVSFGSVALGATASDIVTIVNTSTTTVTLTPPFVVAGADAAQFTIGSPIDATLPAGSSTTVGVTFAPATLGAKTATLTVTSSNGGSPVASLTGTGVCPSIVLSSGLPDGTFNASYSQTITASGGQAPYLFSMTVGTLPTGFTLASSGLLSGTATAAGSFSFTIQASDANSCTGTASYSIAIARATVSVTWPPPSPIVYGTALGATQLNATASTAGSFVYSPPSGTVLTAGSGHTLSVAFTPADVANYETGAASTSIDVTRAPLTVTAADASREFGAADPVFTGSIAGLVAGDVITATYSSTATPASPVGSYPIVPTLSDPGGRLPNYMVAIHNGTLSVVDTTPPVLTLPANITTQAPSPGGAVVSFTASASDAVDGSVPVTCVPASGATFLVGTTTVDCSSTDAHANTATGSFTVTVTAFEPGRMNGDGTIVSGAQRHQFEFRVQDRSSGAESGHLQYRLHTTRPGPDREDHFEATSVTAVIFTDEPGVSPGRRPRSGIDTVSFAGVGRWNGSGGYTFTAQATDAGEPGRRRDEFAITIRDAGGHVVASVDAELTSGNIQSLRANH